RDRAVLHAGGAAGEIVDVAEDADVRRIRSRAAAGARPAAGTDADLIPVREDADHRGLGIAFDDRDALAADDDRGARVDVTQRQHVGLLGELAGERAVGALPLLGAGAAN